LERLKAYPWPGNVRELKNFTERMLIMHAGEEVDVPQLPQEFQTPQGSVSGQAVQLEDSLDGRDFKKARAEFEKQFLASKFEEYQGNVSRLAEAIGLERSYLHRKLKAYGIHAAQ
jgi:two-component system nitrogen regulation response regulator NtrX